MGTNDRPPTPDREHRRDDEVHRGSKPEIRSPWSADDVPANEPSVAGRPDQGQSQTTGAGAGGATESDDRVNRHEGTHATNSAKG